MTRRPTVPVLVALTCVLAFALTGLLALALPGAHERDAAMLHGFVGLDRPRVHDWIVLLAHLADPVPYAAAGLVLALVALGRRLPWRAGAVVVLLVVTGVSTQIVKQLLAQPRFAAWLGHDQIGAASWPSGHSTAAMTLALCAVLVAPPALRALAAVCGGAFAAAVGYAVLVLAWHFPSDVLGGFLMAGAWTALAVAALRAIEPRRAVGSGATSDDGRRRREPVAGLGVVAGAGLAAAAVAAAPRDDLALYASERPTLVVGALVIAALPGALSVGLARAAD